jgi:hypothetical protein
MNKQTLCDFLASRNAMLSALERIDTTTTCACSNFWRPHEAPR